MTEPTLGPLARSEALEIVRGACSRDDINAIEAQPDGAAALHAFIDVLVELSQKLDRTITAGHLLAHESDVNPPAGIATSAAAGVSFTRSDTTTSLTLPANSPACQLSTVEGHLYQLSPIDPGQTIGALFPAGIATGEAKAVALVPGSASTVIAGRIDRFTLVGNGAAGDACSVAQAGSDWILSRNGYGDKWLPRMIGAYLRFTSGYNAGTVARIDRAVGAAPFDAVVISTTSATLVAEDKTAVWAVQEWTDLGFTFTQPADSTRGTDDELESIGRERGRARAVGEDAEVYRASLVALADTVTPAAVMRAILRVTDPLGFGPVVTVAEAGTTLSESEPASGFVPFPGTVWGLTPWGAQQDAFVGPQAALPPAAPPQGLCGYAPQSLVLLHWLGVDLGDPGGYWSDSTCPPSDDGNGAQVPHACTWGVNCWGGAPFASNCVQGTILEALRLVRAHGVNVRWQPRAFL